MFITNPLFITCCVIFVSQFYTTSASLLGKDLEAELVEAVKNEIINELYSEEDIAKYKDSVETDDDSSKHETHGVHNGIPMGKPGFQEGQCDNGHIKLNLDWDGSEEDYTCMESNFWPSQRYDNIQWTPEPIESPKLLPQHVCMDESIVYNETIPTNGPHRPLWAKFGEYEYLPPQRWVHNLEHGSIVALYHPCTNPSEVDTLRNIVNGCIRKHIITPFPHLTKDLPLAVVAWDWKILLPYADEDVITTFIKLKAMKGPEAAVHSDGQFDVGLLNYANEVSYLDSDLCPDK
ncbi:uncharacterized protein LOC144449421 [Glandiceps talaboti]